MCFPNLWTLFHPTDEIITASTSSYSTLRHTSQEKNIHVKNFVKTNSKREANYIPIPEMCDKKKIKLLKNEIIMCWI